jgi:hypothetical protein
MSVYKIQEFNPSKVITGEINPDTVVPVKYYEYPSGSNGVITVDENLDLTVTRRLLSLSTIKTSWSKFQQIVDVTFKELSTSGIIPIQYLVDVNVLENSITTAVITNATNSLNSNTSGSSVINTSGSSVINTSSGSSSNNGDLTTITELESTKYATTTITISVTYTVNPNNTLTINHSYLASTYNSADISTALKLSYLPNNLRINGHSLWSGDKPLGKLQYIRAALES